MKISILVLASVTAIQSIFTIMAADTAKTVVGSTTLERVAPAKGFKGIPGM